MNEQDEVAKQYDTSVDLPVANLALRVMDEAVRHLAEFHPNPHDTLTFFRDVVLPIALDVLADRKTA